MVRVVTTAVVLFAIGSASTGTAQTESGPGTRAGFCATNFPIVLAEGLFAFSHFNIAESLMECGARVFLTDVDPTNSSTVRGAQLLEDIEMVLAVTGADRVNLFAHGQGGLDARVVLETKPSVLASIIQAGAPNLGSSAGNLGVLFGADLLILAGVAGGQLGTNLVAALDDISTLGAASFNAEFPKGLPTEMCGEGPAEVDGVALFSFGGTVVASNLADPADGLLGLFSLGNFAQPNDGFVGRCSSHFGVVVRDDFAMNHLDLVNQTRGAIGPDDPVQVYRMLATRLVGMGL